ncbi:sensor domain-containing diguanylate cyclase [Alloacidobacterium sp.]|uniref:sensor domain-containing diguanylate cyclase n=1 Tax=Alloacidobacterium sp. TaxID=2951999 RepID=UPI002D2B63EA|nr:diguanylate cyclase [Alloacidobacterium sp.]HYK36368.1 diguanylate cyclase [Alloacidobacterium sp.]
MERSSTAEASLVDLKYFSVLAVLFSAVYLIARVSMLFDTGAEGDAAFWWPNAVLLSVLLLNVRKRWPAIFITGYAAYVSAHLTGGDSVPVSFALSGCDILEAAIAAYPFAWITERTVRFSRPRELARLCLVGGFIAPAISAACAAPLYRLLHQNVPPHFGRNWFYSNALGAIIVTPIILSFFDREGVVLLERRRILESTGLLALMSVCSYFVFHTTGFPVFFILFPPLLLIVVRLGMRGGILGVCVIAVFAVISLMRGRGAMTLIQDQSWQHQVLHVQILLACAVLCVALVAVVLNERRLAEQAARKSEQLYRLLAENSRDIIVLTDLNHHREYISPAVQWMMGWDPRELIGATYEDGIVHPDDVAALTAMLEALKSGEPAKSLTYRCRKKDGTYLWMEANISLYCDRITGEPIGYVNVVRNVAERKAAEERLQDAYLALETLASVDPLTGTANRRQLDETLGHEWLRACRTTSPISLLLFDVDHFKFYNDLYGHLRGDTCLRKISDAARQVFRRAGDTVARFGGEEFAIVLPDTDRQGAFEMAQRLRQTVESLRIEHPGSQHNIVTVSVGCATLVPDVGADASVLIEAADRALYEAKRSGRNRVVDAFDPHGQALNA